MKALNGRIYFLLVSRLPTSLEVKKRRSPEFLATVSLDVTWCARPSAFVSPSAFAAEVARWC